MMCTKVEAMHACQVYCMSYQVFYVVRHVLGLYGQIHDMNTQDQCPRTDLHFPYFKFITNTQSHTIFANMTLNWVSLSSWLHCLYSQSSTLWLFFNIRGGEHQQQGSLVRCHDHVILLSWINIFYRGCPLFSISWQFLYW